MGPFTTLPQPRRQDKRAPDVPDGDRHQGKALASAFPGITDNDLDQWGNLKVPTDYRQIYTNLLGSWMGTVRPT